VRDDGRYYFIMEYISGYSVGQWIVRRGCLSERDALVVVHSVAAALAYAWKKSGIVHCDLKPDNIMVDGDGTIKITDLGLAQVVHTIAHGAAEDDGFVTGTPNYMSPEQMHGGRKLDCRSDIYALGMTFYHMVTGRLPYDDKSPAEVMRRQMDDVLEPPQLFNKELSDATAHLVARMTAKNLDDRIQNWDEVLAEVAAVEKQAASNVPVPAPALVPPPPASNAAADEAMGQCLHCTAPVRLTARFCPRCGKPGNVPGAAKVQLRVKPLPELRAARPPHQRMAPASFARPSVTRRRRSFFSWVMDALCLLLSLCLLGFIGFYFYNKSQGEDIIIPLRANIQRVVTEQWLRLRSRFLPAGTENEPSSSSSSSSLSSSLPALHGRVSTPLSEPARREYPAPALREPPPVVEYDVPPELVESMPEERPDYENLLALCRADVPQPGEQLVVALLHHAQDRSGVLREITKDGIMLEMEFGVINLPFDVMTPEYRLRFFPEQRAQLMLRQQR
ncbi:MAG: serine/threonine-protein kinase, partial [Lentisphaerae bacterium]|nr:serine/threonine-protein kinase [Lentisphaerota bacterium]